MVEATRRGLATPVSEMPESRTVEETPDRQAPRRRALGRHPVHLHRPEDRPDLVSSRQEIGRLYRQILAGREPETFASLPAGAAKRSRTRCST
jgi:hypothetical protein